MNEAVREMTFEEEYEILKRESEKVFAKENGCEAPFVNFVLGRALRCIRKLQEQPKIDCSDCSRRKFYQQGYQEGLNADKWISVEERLPEEHCDENFAELIRRGFSKDCFPYVKYSDIVLVTIKTKEGKTEVRKSHTYDGEWYIEWTTKEVGYNKVERVRTDVKVIAWQPLPQPYKKEGAENGNR